MLNPDVDWAAPFQTDKLLEIRSSGKKKMPGINAMSGIDKQLHSCPVKVGKLGIEGDWHDLTFHGGPDKAILGSHIVMTDCSTHYPDWRKSYPERADRFVPGGFGENFVTAHMNERNVCIGDIIQFGDSLKLQVSLPRQPCYKLNHRFSLKNFAPTTYKTSRTGWYYRVVREGTVAVGDEVRLVERKWPDWTIERIQEYLHRVTDNHEMNEKLAAIEALGDESRGMFKNRVAKALRKTEPKVEEVWRKFRVTERKQETPRIISLKLDTKEVDEVLPKMLLGAHARLRLGNGLIRTYSIVSGDEGGVGDMIEVGRITTDVKHGMMSSNHVYVVGGIGITAFIAVMKKVHQINYSLELHYAARRAEEAAFLDRMEPFRDRVKIYDKSKGQCMDIPNLVKTLPWNSKLYVCGPPRMMEAAKAAVEANGLSHDEVHYEAFTADISGDPFEAVVANKDNKKINVGEDESLLEALRREFPGVPSSCEVGNCGTCKIVLKKGQVKHRGSALEPEEQKGHMLSCVSRGLGRIVIEV
ncbi:Amphiphysin-like protein [Cordyceps fumosorosea ARSEF 2679]|uniref:Amphiphysin-like protein n=1 Tax=Cordyceps fumosorosea (strain ARSEF 2679) TaxID=1081104 RepID=A0A162JII2_CORFA|nr:Amphiphysin-like protein [Cordyceps fumosorosea ARSEF 2679]OAA69502.1 Amphiphysin-like protein [Cordyceps fumosorosea ARSEF 2679]